MGKRVVETGGLSLSKSSLSDFSFSCVGQAAEVEKGALIGPAASQSYLINCCGD